MRTAESNFLIFNSQPPCGSALYSEIAPKIIPVIVAIITTKLTYTTVFFVPIALPITSMLGKLKAGPARSSARDGPFPIPEPIRPCRIGTSVKVAKYINAPTTDEKKFAKREFPPTRADIY
jgi:hypothetical protein